ncbi:MAG: hypothetical protein AB7S36_07405 [Planctomycetota bacterium]
MHRLRRTAILVLLCALAGCDRGTDPGTLWVELQHATTSVSDPGANRTWVIREQSLSVGPLAGSLVAPAIRTPWGVLPRRVHQSGDFASFSWRALIDPEPLAWREPGALSAPPSASALGDHMVVRVGSTIAIVNLLDGHQVRTFMAPAAVLDTALSPDGRSLYVATADTRITRYDVQAGRVADQDFRELRLPFFRGVAMARELHVSPCGRFLTVQDGARGERAQQWVIDARAGAPQLALPDGYELLGMLWSSGHALLAGPPPESRSDAPGERVAVAYDLRARAFLASTAIAVGPLKWLHMVDDGRHLTMIRGDGRALELVDLDARNRATPHISLQSEISDIAMSRPDDDGVQRLVWWHERRDDEPLDSGAELIVSSLSGTTITPVARLTVREVRAMGIRRDSRVTISADGKRVTLFDGATVYRLVPTDDGKLKDVTPPILRGSGRAITALAIAPPGDEPGSAGRAMLGLTRANGGTEVWWVDPGITGAAPSDGSPDADRWCNGRVLRADAGGTGGASDGDTSGRGGIALTRRTLVIGDGPGAMRGLTVWSGLTPPGSGARNPVMRQLGGVVSSSVALAADGRSIEALGLDPATGHAAHMSLDMMLPDPASLPRRFLYSEPDDARPANIGWMHLQPGGAWVLSGRELQLWSADLRERRAVLCDAVRAVVGAAGRYAVVQHGDDVIAIHDAARGLTLSRTRVVGARGERVAITALALHGTLVVVGTSDGSVRIRPFPSFRALPEITISLDAWPDHATALMFSADGRYLYVGTAGGRVIVLVRHDTPTAPINEGPLPPATFFERVPVPSQRTDLAALSTDQPLALRHVLRAPPMRALADGDADANDPAAVATAPFMVTHNRLIVAEPGRGLTAFDPATGSRAWHCAYLGQIVALAGTEVVSNFAVALARSPHAMPAGDENDRGPDRVEVFAPGDGRWLQSIRIPPGMQWVRLVVTNSPGRLLALGVTGGAGGLQWFDPQTGALLAFQPGHFTVGAFDPFGDLVACEGATHPRVMRFTRAGTIYTSAALEGGFTPTAITASSREVVLLGPHGIRALRADNLEASPTPLGIPPPASGEWKGPIAIGTWGVIVCNNPGEDATLHATDPNGATRAISLTGQHGSAVVNAVMLLPEANRAIITRDTRGVFRTYRRKDAAGPLAELVQVAPASATRRLCFSHDSRWLAELQDDGTVQVFDTGLASEPRTPGVKATDISFGSVNGYPVLLLGMPDGLEGWNLLPGSRRVTYPAVPRPVVALATSADGTRYVVLYDNDELVEGAVTQAVQLSMRTRISAGSCRVLPAPAMQLVEMPGRRIVVVAGKQSLQSIDTNQPDLPAQIAPASPGYRWGVRETAAGQALPLWIAEGGRVRAASSRDAQADSPDAVVSVTSWLPDVMLIARTTTIELVEDGRVRARWSLAPAGDRITQMVLSPDRTQLAIATRRGGLMCLDVGRAWHEFQVE